MYSLRNLLSLARRMNVDPESHLSCIYFNIWYHLMFGSHHSTTLAYIALLLALSE